MKKISLIIGGFCFIPLLMISTITFADYCPQPSTLTQSGNIVGYDSAGRKLIGHFSSGSDTKFIQASLRRYKVGRTELVCSYNRGSLSAVVPGEIGADGINWRLSPYVSSCEGRSPKNCQYS